MSLACRHPARARDRLARSRSSSDLLRVLVLTEFESGTGYARVVESIFQRLADRFEVHVLALGYDGPQQDEGIKVYAGSGRHDDAFGTLRCRQLVEEIKPQAAVVLDDWWKIGAHLETLKGVAPDLYTVAYCPLDGRILLDELVRPMQLASRIVTFTEFARRDLHAVAARLRQVDSEFNLPPVDVIPLGVDTDIFHPLAGTPSDRHFERERVRSRKIVFPALVDPADQFIVLNANRNTGRKRIDLTMAGFALFARNKPITVKLCLHQRHLGGQDGREIVDLAARYGIADRLLTSGVGPQQEYLCDERLNHVYNACNIGINTSMGEGWGLVSLEHGATGAAQVVPNHTACAEIWEGSAILVEPSGPLEPNIQFLEMEVLDAADIATALERLYTDRQLFRTLCIAAYKKANQADFGWTQISRLWRQLLQEAELDCG